MTTQCSDFRVYVVAQAVKQTGFSGGSPRDLQILGEQRMNALVSRGRRFRPRRPARYRRRATLQPGQHAGQPRRLPPPSR
ncbi:MAG: hypothetical protein WDO13_08130 [Verrucomicrobiota bacterium]